ncbi:hypothetical protein AVEN_178315-1 [Araneus ventricosus]|uniref:Uncharacterized protein n=1 Tax=Araneus ventricosus TaxID=182803 RepID=A0A4Y2Q1R4_ARAVE|nr:hypothetical protein AVEN_178315-1 [Araneus ventricosus]
MKKATTFGEKSIWRGKKFNLADRTMLLKSSQYGNGMRKARTCFAAIFKTVKSRIDCMRLKSHAWKLLNEFGAQRYWQGMLRELTGGAALLCIS